MPTLKDEISEVLDRLCACWNATKLWPILELWDPEETEPYALPQEIGEPVIGWDAYKQYLINGEERLFGSSMRYWDLRVKPLTEDLTVALYQMHWNGHVKGFPLPMGVDTRVTALFRKRGDQWLICHYVEAPQAFLSYVFKQYARNVDEGFVIDYAASTSS